MNYKSMLGFGASFLLLTACNPENKNQEVQSENGNPNIVIIYCDDLGYGDLGCFGANDIQTPNIDGIAEQGIKFTEFYSASPICSPSRAGLMTGRLPQRMGVHGVFFPESYTGMPVEEITIADVLKNHGYTTGIVGKWHLGHMHRFLPLQRGFDEYFGIPYSNDMESVVYMEGNEVVEFNPDQTYTTKTYTEKAIDFIERHKEEPFFLYLAHSMPHVPIYASEDFLGTSERGLYGDVIQELDWSVGQVMKTLQENGLKENTLLVFSSDNGPWLVMREHGGSAGFLREGKQYTFEGGMRVPTLAMWPAKIEGGRVYDDMALMVDWFPTISDIVGEELRDDRDYDGESILPVLEGTDNRKGDQYLYFDNQNLQCYRHGDWKVKKAFEGSSYVRWRKYVPPHPTLLINLKEDSGEQINLAEVYPEKLEQMLHEMDSMREAMGDLPPALVIKTDADNSHYDYLVQKYGEDYFMQEY
ncbi:MAG: sulfatase family protein [Bacteroidales bacterium]